MSNILDAGTIDEMHRMGEKSGMKTMTIPLRQTLSERIFGEHYSKWLAQISWISESGLSIILLQEGEHSPTLFIWLARKLLNRGD